MRYVSTSSRCCDCATSTCARRSPPSKIGCASDSASDSVSAGFDEDQQRAVARRAAEPVSEMLGSSAARAAATSAFAAASRASALRGRAGARAVAAGRPGVDRRHVQVAEARRLARRSPAARGRSAPRARRASAAPLLRAAAAPRAETARSPAARRRARRRRRCESARDELEHAFGDREVLARDGEPARVREHLEVSRGDAGSASGARCRRRSGRLQDYSLRARRRPGGPTGRARSSRIDALVPRRVLASMPATVACGARLPTPRSMRREQRRAGDAHRGFGLPHALGTRSRISGLPASASATSDVSSGEPKLFHQSALAPAASSRCGTAFVPRRRHVDLRRESSARSTAQPASASTTAMRNV